MNNLLSYCGLVDARISASEKDLPYFASAFSDNWGPGTKKEEITKGQLISKA